MVSNKLLPILKAQKGEEGADDRTHNEVKPVVECGLGPERRPEGLNAAEGIVKEEPGAVLHLIAQHPEEHQKDDQNHGGDIAAGRLSGEIKSKAPQDQY